MISALNVSDPGLTKFFWSVLTIEAVLLGIILLVSLLTGWVSVGVLIAFIPAAVMAITAGVFHVADARWVRISCTLVLLSPAIAMVVGPPITTITNLIGEGVGSYQNERYRRGELLFKEPGQRKVAAAIADRDIEKLKAALPGVGDVNRAVDRNLSDNTPSADKESLLSFACMKSDDSEASAKVIRLLLAAGADPNVPPGKPLRAAIASSMREMEMLLDAGADPNFERRPGEEPVWWSVLEPGRDQEGKKLQILLARGVDTTRRTSSPARGVIDQALADQNWKAARLLAEQIPGGKDYVPDPEVHERLTYSVGYAKRNGQPVDEDIAAAVALFDAAKKRAGESRPE